VDQAISIAPPFEAPRGIFSARVDEKGRLKLPAAFKEYISGFGVKKVFVTSLDCRIARLYPIAVWRSNEKFFDEFTDDPEAAEDVAFIANDLGADCEMDDQGRVLIPQELRRQLGIENQPVWLESYQGLVNIYSKEIYEERKRRATERLAEKLSALKKKGLK
jgi:MraZ protein